MKTIYIILYVIFLFHCCQSLDMEPVPDHQMVMEICNCDYITLCDEDDLIVKDYVLSGELPPHIPMIHELMFELCMDCVYLIQMSWVFVAACAIWYYQSFILKQFTTFNKKGN